MRQERKRRNELIRNEENEQIEKHVNNIVSEHEWMHLVQTNNMNIFLMKRI